MKIFNLMAMISLTTLLWSCGGDEVNPDEFGTFQVYFENKVGAEGITLRAPGSTDYDYETSDGGPFNLSSLGYYVSKVTLEGPNGEYFQDEMSATADESKGYYLLKERQFCIP